MAFRYSDPLRLAACVTALLVGFTSNLPQHWRASAACASGATTITAYWIPIEGTEDMTSSGDIVELKGPQTRPLVDSTGQLIAQVAEPTFQRCREEGACFLIRGGLSLLLSYVRGENVFERLNIVDFPFGVGGWSNKIELFLSVASSDFARGTKLYIPELDGLDLKLFGRGHIHNGCVRVDDVGPGRFSCSIRFFAGSFHNFGQLRSSLSGQVYPQERSSCELLNYAS